MSRRELHTYEFYCDHPGCLAVYVTESTEREAWGLAYEAGWRLIVKAYRTEHRCPDHAVEAVEAVKERP